MPSMITGLYAALLVLLSLVLAGLVGATRARKKTISLSDGGDAELFEAMRRHANLVEYVSSRLHSHDIARNEWDFIDFVLLPRWGVVSVAHRPPLSYPF